MTPATVIAADLQQALSLVTLLAEGGIDPFSSPRAQATLEAVCLAQEALEEALRRGSEVHSSASTNSRWGRCGMMLKGPLYLQTWGAFCAYCQCPIESDEPVFLHEVEPGEAIDAYVHQDCITAYVKRENLCEH